MSNVTPALLFIAATLLAVKSQNIAYIFYDLFPVLEPFAYLVITTGCTLILYFAASVLSYKVMKRSDMWNGRYFLMFSVIVVLGGIVSLMSLLILAMWKG